jgi:hypothetical protein
LRKIPAKIIDPATGASQKALCAIFREEKRNGNIGTWGNSASCWSSWTKTDKM